MTKKVLFMLLLAIVTAVNVAAKATNYGIKIANMEVTSNNCKNITHKCITPYTEGVESYVRFDPQKKVLTFCNVNIECKDKYGRCLYNYNCDGLTVVFKNRNRFNSTKAATVRIEKNTTITCEDGMYGKDMIDMFGHYDKNETIFLKNKAVLTFKDANVFVSFPAGTDIAGIRGEGNEYLSVDHSYLRVHTGAFGICIKKISRYDINYSCLTLDGGKCTEDAQCNMEDGCEIITDFKYSVDFKNNTINIDGSPAKKITFDNPISIDSNKFPDENFRSYVKNLRYLWKGKLTSEAMGYSSFNVSGLGIKSLKGIEYFKALRVLNCSNNQLTSLDLSKNKRLENIDISFNRMNTTGMSNFIKSLPKFEPGYGTIYVVTEDGKPDGNICTSGHVADLLNKNWKAYMQGGTEKQYKGVKNYEIYVAGNGLTNENYNRITSLKGIKGNVTFDPYDYTLTLESASIDGRIGNYSESVLTINSSKISTVDSINARELTIKGDGTLNVKKKIESCKELTLCGNAKVYIDTKCQAGIYPYINGITIEPNIIRVSDNAILKVRAKDMAIFAVTDSKLILSGNAKIRIPEYAKWDATGSRAKFVSMLGNSINQAYVHIGANEKVSDISISDLTMPKDFEHGDYEATTKSEGCKFGNIVYKDHKTGKVIDAKTQYFTGGEEVEIHVTMKADVGYEFTKTTKCLLNNKKQDAITFDSKATDFCYIYTVPVPEDGISIQKFTATITAPKAGEKPQLTIDNLDAKHLKIIGVYWNDMDENNLVVKQMYRTYVNGEYRVSNENETFEAGHKYMLMIKLEPTDGYIFHEKTSYVINGNEKDIKISWAPHRANLTYTFPKLPEDKTTGIENVSADEDGKWYNLNGTELSGKPSKGGIYIFNGRKVVVNK